MKNYLKQNQRTFDRWVKEGWEWGKAITHTTYKKALDGKYKLFLTPTKPIPKNWLEDLKNKPVLGLAAGGGQQGPILSALGAHVTIIDFSAQQIATEKKVAQREGYQITTLQKDITEPLPFKDNSFDLVVYPVSNVYIKDIQPIWVEIARVLKLGGECLSGLDNGVNFIVDEKEQRIINHLPFNPLKDPKQLNQLKNQDCGLQFSHTIEEQIGGQLQAGLSLTDLYSDTNGIGRLDRLNIPSFWATQAKNPKAKAIN